MGDEMGTAEGGSGDRWRRRLHIPAGRAQAVSDLESVELEGIEPAAPAPSAEQRIEQAREEMRRIVMDRLGGDAALLAGVDSLRLTGEEAVQLLRDGEAEIDEDQAVALEVIVAFDGTRPSFLIRNGEIDLESSLTSPEWRTTLEPRLNGLADAAACVGRVEMDNRHIGTAFLISPTLALTNRHVVQAIADFGVDPPDLLGQCFLDFGREHQGRDSHDRRRIRAILGAGTRQIVNPIDHSKFDAALIEVTPSTLTGEAADRHLTLSNGTGGLPTGGLAAAIGYPASWRTYVPAALRTRYEEVLEQLLAGDGGTKRFAPGETGGMAPDPPGWTGRHDATTLNGNSGSPMLLLKGEAIETVGLHYGGQWAGDRVNWAHMLAKCRDAKFRGDGATFATVLAERGVAG
ncbi:MAG TPA: trypsin-like peptidase domain-containing protein [Allosphingosinicella sp.]|jgi:hypothetical protein